MEELYSDPRIGTLVFEIGQDPLVQPMTEKAAIDYILASLRGGPADDLRRAFDTMRSVKSYRRLIKHAAKANGASRAFTERFHTAWTVNGFRWREALSDDALLSRALRSILPAYDGGDLVLFRGEQATRFDAGRLGFNWTAKRDVAEMFASGLCCTYEGGGVLLTAQVSSAAIIAPPSSHSQYLGEDEYVVEPGFLTGAVELVRHPQKYF